MDDINVEIIKRMPEPGDISCNPLFIYLINKREAKNIFELRLNIVLRILDWIPC